MDFDNFYEMLYLNAKKIGITIEEKEGKQFYKYMNVLLEWNQNINLTAIKEPKEIIIKHFVDSLTINNYIKEKAKIIDVGTGAGFPGIPIAIHRPDLRITLLDSLNKRVNFLKEVISLLDIKNIEAIHGRAEDIGINNAYREQYDIAVSRAVAPINVLSEYLIPFVKIGGQCIYMKGPNYIEEMVNVEKVFKELGGKKDRIEKINLESEGLERNLIIIKKVKETDKRYPRKAGIPSKTPLK